MNANDKAGAKPMPVTGSGCGIRPSEEAMEVGFAVDFSQAKTLLPADDTEAEQANSADTAQTQTPRSSKP